ncbi:MAG: hypothetical protein LiPW15_529 [Parcubacteria group bacterium LiPW_15]|nr:MAG: hypothetical protein LiPW15_529 [Parcubacteria group bacterium LiPW_15]
MKKRIAEARKNYLAAVKELFGEMWADGKYLKKEWPKAFWLGAPIATFLFLGPVFLGQPAVIIVYFVAKPAAAKKFLATARGKTKKGQSQHREAG